MLQWLIWDVKVGIDVAVGVSFILAGWLHEGSTAWRAPAPAITMCVAGHLPLEPRGKKGDAGTAELHGVSPQIKHRSCLLATQPPGIDGGQLQLVLHQIDRNQHISSVQISVCLYIVVDLQKLLMAVLLLLFSNASRVLKFLKNLWIIWQIFLLYLKSIEIIYNFFWKKIGIYLCYSQITSLYPINYTE